MRNIVREERLPEVESGLLPSVVMTYSEGNRFDFRGSTVALTDQSGKVVERFGYGPYGEVVSGERTQTPFLFNGMYGVMSDGNGLYYMRARFYSPVVKRFVNQDILIGSVAEGQSLNRFAFVMGQPVNWVDPFGLFATEDGISLGLDFMPVVGSCKGVAEFFSGKDPITGEPIPRWIAALGIIPFGKYLTRTEKVGEAIVYVYQIPRQEVLHTSILVKLGEESIHTHQVITSLTTMDTKIVEPSRVLSNFN